MISTKSFRNFEKDEKKLKEFGFIKSGETYTFSKEILDDFIFSFSIKGDEIKVDVIEKDLGEPYPLFYVQDAVGTFIGEINSACEEIANEILDKCFNRCVFKSDSSKALIEYVKNRYDDDLEFLWEKFSQNAIWRRKDNQKWYAVMAVLPKNKLGLNSNELVDIAVIRANHEKYPNLIDGKGILEGYHMNKKNWISVLLDGSVSQEKIKELIDESYLLAGEVKKKK